MNIRVITAACGILLSLAFQSCITQEASDPVQEEQQPIIIKGDEIVLQNARIAGKIMQSDSKAKVELVQGRAVKTSSIDATDGYFEIDDIKPGTYQLKVKSDDYVEYTLNLEVDAGHAYAIGLLVLALKNDKFEDSIPSIYDHAPQKHAEIIYLPPDKYNNGSAPLYVSVSFDRAMDRKSVEEAFNIEPAVDGGYFSWFQNTKTFTTSSQNIKWTGVAYDNAESAGMREADQFEPSAEITTYSTMKAFTYTFPRTGCFTDTTYKITISQAAKDTAGTPLDSALEFEFKTVQSAVSYDDIQMLPRNGEDWVNLLAPQGINLTFPARMNEASVESNISIDLVERPFFIWRDYNEVNIYTGGTFIPDTTYTVTINGDALNLGGTPLGETKKLTFSTAPIRVTSSTPAKGTFGVKTNVIPTIRFNTYMDRTSFASFLSLTDFDGNDVPGVINNYYVVQRTSPPDTIWYLDQITFQPSAPLKRNMAYTLQVEPGVKDLHGVPMKTDYRLEFVTMP